MPKIIYSALRAYNLSYRPMESISENSPPRLEIIGDSPQSARFKPQKTRKGESDMQRKPASIVDLSEVTGREIRGRWAILLAGGEGERMRPAIKRWLGEERPKQYCTFVGRRSMLQHAVDRAMEVVQPARLVTVIGRGHRAYIQRAAVSGLPGCLYEQPGNRGTAAAIFSAASHIITQDPEATVLILPSDQFVYPEERFVQEARRACEFAEKFEDQLILLGVAPDHLETEYGWIEPSNDRERSVSQGEGVPAKAVNCFCEKPGRREAGALLRRGGLWNTMVAAVKVKTLWALGWQCIPEVMEKFETYRQVLLAIRQEWVANDHAAYALAYIYQKMDPADFSYHILQHAASHCRVIPMQDVFWSDWGRLDRIKESLDRLSACPAFPLACLEAQ